MEVFAAAAEAIRLGRPAALATVIAVGGSAPRAAGARLLLGADGALVGTIGGGALEHRVLAMCREVMTSGRPIRWSAHLVHDLGMCCGGQVEVYVEPLEVREPLVIFGAGHVAHALAPLVSGLGFAVTVVDERDDLLTPERFPDCTLHGGDPLAFAQALPGGRDAWWLVATHDHALDQALGETLLPKTFGWLGMIGSRAKIARFFVRWEGAGLDRALFTRLSAPVGLDVGAETPLEIAVAIAAEMIAIRRRSTGPARPLSAEALGRREGPAVPPRR
jgi:xanthine dehydrogenase accessory factor